MSKGLKNRSINEFDWRDQTDDSVLYGMADRRNVWWLPALTVVSLVAEEQLVGHSFVVDYKESEQIAMLATPRGIGRRALSDLTEAVTHQYLKDTDEYYFIKYGGEVTAQAAAELLVIQQHNSKVLVENVLARMEK